MNRIFTILITGIFLTSFVFSQSVSAEEVPSWIKNNAGWWAEGAIDDTAFLQGIQFLIKEGIVSVEQESQSTPMRGGGFDDEINNESDSGNIHIISISKTLPDCGEYCYDPSSLLVIEGDLVIWVNESEFDQIITSGNPDDGFSGVFQSSVIAPGDDFEHLFDTLGEFDYYSITEPWMMGTIEVSSPPPIGNEDNSDDKESDNVSTNTASTSEDESNDYWNWNEVEITTLSQNNEHSKIYTKDFTKYVNVFGVNVFASESVSDSKLQHAANVLAQYLDNDKDGIADNRKVVDALVANNSWLYMFADEDEEENSNLSEENEENDDLFDSSCSLNLFAEETNPSDEFDASLEEVLHLITQCGYANAYPDVFGEEPGTEIANIMDNARGGHFENVPSSYPSGAWYVSEDSTCEYSCMITEYFYWSLTSILGAHAERWEDVANEWELNTESKVKSTDKEIYDLLTDPQYKLPTVLPNGNY